MDHETTSGQRIAILHPGSFVHSFPSFFHHRIIPQLGVEDHYTLQPENPCAATTFSYIWCCVITNSSSEL
jgi:hypothetical protein